MSSVVIGTDFKTGTAISIDDSQRRRGLYILGKPNIGKRALLVNIMLQDIANGHSVFFLDPHGDTIEDLQKYIPSSRHDAVTVLDPTAETSTIGINLLACKDIRSFTERESAFTRAYSVFYKLWEEQWGAWLQLILQNVLWAFIENPAYTLADVPKFLHPRNTEFRNHIIDNITYSPPVADFWRYGFWHQRDLEQQERVDAALTRINTLLTNPYIQRIFGQRETTLDFVSMLASQQIVLFKLSPNLPPDTQKFLGALLISELLHALRKRPEEKRLQHCVFVDEFTLFVHSEDIRLSIIEGWKFGSALTLSHAEQPGQFRGNHTRRPVTAMAIHEVLFQLTTQDALALAPEFADPPTQDKTQADMIAEMTAELATLPRFIAYAKVIQESAQAPRVLKRKIRILN
jgi:hypothetical protein